MPRRIRSDLVFFWAIASSCWARFSHGFAIGPPQIHLPKPVGTSDRRRPIVDRRSAPPLGASPDVSSDSAAASSGAEASDDASSQSADPDTAVVVALTREAGKNSKLRTALSAHPAVTMSGMEFDLREVPCVEHAVGEDREALVDIISSGRLGEEFDYVVITSPEAARVLAEAIGESSGDGEVADATDSVKVAAVGRATGKALSELGIDVDFVPSRADGETLAAELPPATTATDGGGGVSRVLYPASAKAADTIEEGLQSRGGGGSSSSASSEGEDGGSSTTAPTFAVTRLNTYDTVAATFTSEQLADIDRIDVACFGSPSSVRAWLDNVDVARGLVDMDDEEKKKLGPEGNGNVLAACIGKTTAQACLQSERWHANDIYYPKENPGMEGWAASAAQAMGDAMERKFWS